MESTSLSFQRQQRRSLLWRVHFWSALICSPIALIATLTGLLFVVTPQIENILYSHLDTVTPTDASMPLDASIQAALNVVPKGWILHSVAPAQLATDSVRVVFVKPAIKKDAPNTHTGHDSHGSNASNRNTSRAPEFLRPNFGLPKQSLVFYVNPYTAQVLGSLPESERFNVWTRKLHSNYLQNDNWRWIIELGASWLLVMLITGVYLAWPNKQDSIVPSRNAQGRLAWKQWHLFIGLTLAVVSAVIIVTGLTWSKNAGEQIRFLRDITGQKSPRIPAYFKSAVPEQGKQLTWDQAFSSIKTHGPDVSMQIMAPTNAQGVWRANQLDRGQPTRGFDLLIDAYSGAPLYYSGWEQQTAFGKATAIGIPFHRGEFGLWNQLLLVAFGLGLIFSIVSGWMMLFIRYKRGAGFLPRLVPQAWRSIGLSMGVSAILMFIAMPLLLISTVPVLLIEIFIWRKSIVR